MITIRHDSFSTVKSVNGVTLPSLAAIPSYSNQRHNRRGFAGGSLTYHGMSAEQNLAEIETIVEAYKSMLLKIKKKGSFPKKPVERDTVRGLGGCGCILCPSFWLFPVLQLLAERDDLKKRFISNKKECRAAIEELPKKKKEARTRQLADLQSEFRLIDEEFKAFKDEETRVSMEKDRDELFDGAKDRKDAREEFDPSKATNKDLLSKSSKTASKTTDKLRAAMQDIESAADVRVS